MDADKLYQEYERVLRDYDDFNDWDDCWLLMGAPDPHTPARVGKAGIWWRDKKSIDKF